jgi:hypothetical protein
LTEKGADEPPYMLKDEERSFLKFMSGRVPERLRERIDAQVSRASIIPLQEEEVLNREPQEHEQPADVTPPSLEKDEPARRAAGERPAVVAVSAKRGEPATEVAPPSQPAPIRPAEAAGEAAACTLPDEEVKWLTIQYELARARAGVLRAAEEEFKASPHHWTSPKYKLSLAGIEEKIARSINEGEDVSWLHEARERVQQELAAERVQSPLRRQKAEQVASRKGIVGAFGRLVEPESRRSLREQLTETKGAYLAHLRVDSEGRRAFHEDARKTARECRELGRKFGHLTPVVLELSEEKIREARDHAIMRTGSLRDGWLTACTQSQKLKEERELAAVAAARAAKTVEVIIPRAHIGEQRAEQNRGELEVNRGRASVEDHERLIRTVTDQDRPTQSKDPVKNIPEPDKGSRSSRGR